MNRCLCFKAAVEVNIKDFLKDQGDIRIKMELIKKNIHSLVFLPHVDIHSLVFLPHVETA